MLASWHGEVRGAFAVTDTVKASAAAALARLCAMGLRPALLTGDSAVTARAVASAAGIDEVVSEALPAAKARVVERLENEGRSVAMVGDGVNDGPALAAARLGLALGSGTDVAIAADMILLRDDLAAVPDAIALARAAFRTIRANLAWAFCYNVLAIPLAALGLANPLAAAATMTLSSVFVVWNSLRLRRFSVPAAPVTPLAALTRRAVLDGHLDGRVLTHAAEPGWSRQMVSELRAAASASVLSAAGRARATVRPAGKGGRARQEALGPARVSPRPPDRTMAVAPPGPKDADSAYAPPSRNADDSRHCWPPSLVQAASRLADGPVPASSSATSPPRPGPAAGPARAARSGRRPGPRGKAARTRREVSMAQPPARRSRPAGRGRATKAPSGAAASASGTSARPEAGGSVAQARPPSRVVVMAEKVRYRLGAPHDHALGPLDDLEAVPLASRLVWAAWRAGQKHACAEAGWAARRQDLSSWRDGPELPWGTRTSCSPLPSARASSPEPRPGSSAGTGSKASGCRRSPPRPGSAIPPCATGGKGLRTP